MTKKSWYGILIDKMLLLPNHLLGEHFQRDFSKTKKQGSVCNLKQKKLSDFIRIAATAAIYVTLTLAIAPLSYGPVQLRLAEVMTLLCFFRKDYGYGLILGCAISNLFSPLGMLDMIFGVASTIFAVVWIPRVKNLWIASLFPTISMVFIAWELKLLGSPFWFSLLTCSIGEFIAVTLLGVPLFLLLKGNRFFRETVIKSDKN